jgi:hypothetical protein
VIEVKILAGLRRPKPGSAGSGKRRKCEEKRERSVT